MVARPVSILHPSHLQWIALVVARPRSTLIPLLVTGRPSLPTTSLLLFMLFYNNISTRSHTNGD